MKLLNYIGISRTVLDSDNREVLNSSYHLAKKVKHLNCDSLYLNYCSQSQCIRQVGSFWSIDTLVNYYEESFLPDEQILRFAVELSFTAEADSLTPITTHWRRIEKVWKSCFDF